MAEPGGYAVMTSLDDLADLYRVRGELEKAEGFLKESLEIRLALMGPGDVTVRAALRDLGAIRLEAGDLDAAEELLYEAFGPVEGREGRNAPAEAKGLLLIAELSRRRGDAASAEELSGRALDLLYQHLGPRGDRRGADPTLNLSKIARCWTSLARAMADQPEKRAAAEVFAAEALRVQRENEGAPNVDGASTLEVVAELAIRRGDLARAECFSTEAREVRLAARSDETPDSDPEAALTPLE